MKYSMTMLLLTILCLMPLGSQAKELTTQEKEVIKTRVAQKVSEFTKSLSRMVDDTQSTTVRDAQHKNILNLFLAKGEPYDMEIEGIMTHSTGVKMQTSSVNSTTKNTQLLKKYITRLYNPATKRSQMAYEKIEITTADYIEVGEIYPEGDHYVCNAVFYQHFKGTRPDGSSYDDTTSKIVKGIILPLHMPDGTTIYESKLGDIYVTKTQRGNRLKR